MDLDPAKRTFILECRELLDAMEESLLAMEGLAPPMEAVNAIFRAVHTIKGSAGLFGLEGIVGFSHALENVMDRVRDGRAPFTPRLAELLLRCRDHLGILVDSVQEDREATATEAEAGEVLRAALRPFLEAPVALRPAPEARPGPAGEPEAGRDLWHLSLRFAPSVLRDGMDPLSFLRYLKTMGRFASVHPILDGLPRGEAFDPETCYLGLEIDFETAASREALEDVFEFVREGSRIRLIPPQAKVDEYVALIRELPEADGKLGEILVEGGCLTRRELEEALRVQEAEVPPSKLGAILVRDQDVPPPLVAAALDRQKDMREHRAADLQVVKVSAPKLDKLVDLVGELVIAGASAQTLAGDAKDRRLLEAAAGINKLVEEIRDNALSLRMVQIAETFNRFRRVVRDAARELGKAIDLEIKGGETELDKAIVEKIADPLLHLVRNAIDHGIEPREVRAARGKPEAGTLRLSACHETGSILIEVSDDGGGLDRAKILAKAVERGLVPAGAELSGREAANLIFEPGFSTAERVSDLSGRGVGMDVVRKNIDELRGTVEVESLEGQGTTFRIRLPLTLAIIDGFRVEAGPSCYVLPMDTVIECLDLEPFLESAENHLVNLRGEVLPFLRLREVFGMEGAFPPRERVVVVQAGEDRAGIVVDRLLGEFQTVIKPLGELFRNLRGIGGSTILGTGEVALILDVPQLVQLATLRRASPAQVTL